MWRKIVIKDHQHHLAMETKLMESFSSGLTTACAAEGYEAVAKAAMYTKRIRNDLFFYFTPETMNIFNGGAWDIQPCEKPEGVKLHLGDSARNPLTL